MGCEPWVIDPDEAIPPWVWANRTLTVMSVEAEYREWQQKQQQSKQRMKRR